MRDDNGHLLRESLLAPPRGLLLVGHGTRSAAGTQQFLEVSAALAKMAPGTLVEPAFLELAEPDILTAVRTLHRRGARTIVAVPLLLAAADHVKQDIPAAVKAAASGISPPDLSLIFAEHLGTHTSVIELSRQRYREANANLSPVSPEVTCHLLVGRGTHDPAAIAEVQQFASLRADRTEAAQCRLAFLAMAQPGLAEELHLLASMPFRRVMVQPHLLFAGDLVSSIEKQVADLAGQPLQQEWLTAAVLADPAGKPQRGADLLALAAWERFVAAIRVVANVGGG